MAIIAPQKGRILRLLRTLHSWLGIFIFPWVIVIGATGFYLNHSDLVLSVLQGPAYDESVFDDWPSEPGITEEGARETAMRVWPGEAIRRSDTVNYHNRRSFEFVKDSGRVIVSHPTGHYFVKTSFFRRTYAPDGQLLHVKVYWGSMFKRLHVRGWFDSSLGTWLADLTSIAMVVFGFSGLVLWTAPRLRRVRRAVSRRS